ncbi:MAG: hypothetical protein ABJZ54_10495 [Luteolibacter sp.]
MKITTVTLTAMALLTPWIFAEDNATEKSHEGHDHADHSEETHADVKTIEGPNKGRIITSTEPHVEFFVTADRKILLTFLDDENRPVAVEAPVVSAIGGERANPTRMTFEASGEGGALLSDVALPEGNDIPIILQIKTAPDADNVTEKFNINLANCPTCAHPEYACTCDHGEEGHGGHDHEGHEGHDH